ncbi:MAG: hypothetical protein JXR68_10345 [Bacteroidales bacterium]|nr:hypothetical protein [Bacteroidales bacterium]
MQLCRWHAVDKLAENYMSQSPYSYARNNPINYVDILGLMPDTDIPTIGGIVGVAYEEAAYKKGNISAVQWATANNTTAQTYMYQYDNLNRLTTAIYSPQGNYDVDIQCNLNGNITHLQRKGQIITTNPFGGEGSPETTISYNYIDDLTYSYVGNKLNMVNDDIGDINTPLNNDFRDNGAYSFNEYLYDYNCNMTFDANKNIEIEYNFLDLPTKVTQQNKIYSIEYKYTAGGA